MNLSNPTLAWPLGAVLLCGGLFLGSGSVGADTSQLSPAAERFAAERFGVPHGVVEGRAEVVSYTTRFHGDPAAEPLYRVQGEFELEDFPYPSQGKHASVFFLRKEHYAAHVTLRALADGKDPELGRIEFERIPDRGGAVVGVLAKVKRGHKEHGIVRYEAGRVAVRSQDGRLELELATSEDGTFKAPLPPGIYELSALDHSAKPKWIRVEARRSSLAVLEVSEPLPEPGEEPPLSEARPSQP